MHGGAPFGAKILSAVRNREGSASRRVRYRRFHCINTNILLVHRHFTHCYDLLGLPKVHCILSKICVCFN